MAISNQLITGFIALVVIYLYLRWKSASLPLPPGPKGYPIIRNLFDMPRTKQWVTFMEWSRQLGSDIVYVNAAGTSIAILNSASAANDLLEKKSSIYSSRPRMPMINELMGWDWCFLFMPYGGAWRKARKLFQREFHPSLTDRYRPHTLKATHYLLRQFLNTPDEFLNHLQHFASSIILSIAYGIEVQSQMDPFIQTAEKAIYDTARVLVPGAYLVDSLPVLSYVPGWFPGAGFKKQAREWKKTVVKMVNDPFEVVKREMANGTAKPSFASYALEKVDNSKDVARQENVIRGSVGTMYIAGTGSTVSSLSTFILAIVMNQEIQSKAQQELDAVIGSQLPTFADRASLPYITAIVKEVIRWQPVAPLAAPHLLTADDEYRGFRIPKGTLVFGNSWAILHNEGDYPDPYAFKPERFLSQAGKINPEVKDPATAAFGYGRRICAGMDMSFEMIWIVVASILATMEIHNALDEDGSAIEPSGEYSSGMIHAPLPYRCSITPRTKGSETLIQSTDSNE